MKNYILIFVLSYSFIAPSFGQMTLVNTFSGNNKYLGEVVNLSISGEKIAVIRSNNYSTTPDTIYLYNLDYSYWKSIPLSAESGFQGDFYFANNDNIENYGISYISETLFNDDSLLEAAVYYSTDTNVSWGKELIINEDGVILDSVLNEFAAEFSVHYTSSSTYIAIATTSSGVQVYQLPGYLPCATCANPTGLTQIQKKPIDILSAPIPNPSKNQVKITFTLPEGATIGILAIYNTEGQEIKSYNVDNRFGFILVDDSQFPPGMYYYNLSVNGVISSSQKMVVIK